MTKVLYIEDNDDNVYMLKMRLELLGDFEVLAAEHFSLLSCGILATAIKPDANGPSCSLKTGTLRPTLVRRAAASIVPGGGHYVCSQR